MGGQDLDYLTLNNTIVGLRPAVKQAKVHLIHQLSRQIKTLQARNITVESAQLKRDRKLDRFRQEIMLIKDAPRDAIARFALQNRRTFEAIAPSEDMDLRAKVRLANHKAVLAKVQAFRQKYPKWDEEVQRLLPALGAKQIKKSSGVKARKIEKVEARKREMMLKRKGLPLDQPPPEKKKKKAVKKLKEVNMKKKPMEEEEMMMSEDEEDEEDEEEEEVLNKGTEPEVEESEEEEDVEKNFAGSLKNLIQKNSAEDSESVVEESENEEHDQASDDNEEEVTDDNIEDQEETEDEEEDEGGDEVIRNGEMEIRSLSLNDMSAEESEEETPAEGKPKSSAKSGKSSFFQGGESEEEEEEEATEDDSHLHEVDDTKRFQGDSFFGHVGDQRGRSRGGHRGSFRDRGRGRSQDRGSYGTRGSFRGRGRGLDRESFRGRGCDRGSFRGRGMGDRGRGFDRGSYRGGDRGSFRGERGDRGHVRGGRGARTLHPSWEAKKNANPGLAEFQGRKTTFNESGASTSASSFPSQASNKGNHDFQSKAGPPKHVHPSWAAKKEMNKGLAPFQGKKIVF